MFLLRKIFIIIVVIFIVSCSNKKEILGKREVVFSNSNITISNTEKIYLSKTDYFNEYYGDSSLLNKNITNYKISNRNFFDFYISKKRLGINNYYFSNPIVVDNIVYSLDTKGNLFAKNLNNLDGENLWKTKVISKINFINYYGGKIGYHDNTIYITSRLNEIIAINKDGTIKWKKQINSIPISTPVISNNNIYVITNDNKLYAFDTKDGRIKWIHYGTSKDSAVFGSANPVIYKDYIVASYSSGELFILNKNTGESIFETSLVGKHLIFSNFELTDIDTTPQIKNNILVASANNGITIGLNLDTLEILWKQNLSSLTNIIIDNNFIYMITTNNNLVNISLKNGTINYYEQLPKYINEKKQKGNIFYKNILLVNDELLAFNNLNEYKVINPLNGKIKQTLKTDIDFCDKPISLNKKLFGIGFDNRKLKIVY